MSDLSILQEKMQRQSVKTMLSQEFTKQQNMFHLIDYTLALNVDLLLVRSEINLQKMNNGLNLL